HGKDTIGRLPCPTPSLRSRPMRIMRIALLALLVALVGCAANPTHTARGPQTITVMTYNIHHGAGGDGRVDLERIATVIRAANPDVVALQELDSGVPRTNGAFQAEELARLTKMQGVFGPAMDYEGGKYGDAVLCRFTIVSNQ